MVEMAKANGVNVYHYLTYLLEKLPNDRMSDEELDRLAPWNEEVKAEMAELNRIRYWTRKVIPDALPRVSDGRVSVEDAMETAGNRKELEQVEDEATQTAARQPQEQEKQKVKQQEEIVPM